MRYQIVRHANNTKTVSISTEPLKNYEIPDKPWTNVGMNLFKIQGRTYLIVEDYYSKYSEINKLLNNTSPIVIKKMKAMFARPGIPKLVFSDNGPEFISLEFRKFSANWDFEHDTASPEFAQSNGMVKRTIQTVKRTPLKWLKSGDDKDFVLLALCMVTNNENTSSTVTKLIKCELRTLLPRIKEPIYNQHKKFLPLIIGDHVRLHDGKTWSRKGKVIKRCEQPRSYLILKENSRKPRRNRCMLAIPQLHALKVFPYPKRTNISPPEIPEHQPTTTKKMVRTRVGRKLHPFRRMHEYTS